MKNKGLLKIELEKLVKKTKKTLDESNKQWIMREVLRNQIIIMESLKELLNKP